MFHTLIKVSYWSFPLLFLCGLFLPLVLSTCFIYLRGLVKWKCIIVIFSLWLNHSSLYNIFLFCHKFWHEVYFVKYHCS
jgi:hypothetical protein